MNKQDCIEVYGELIADYIDERIIEDYGINGHDAFVELDQRHFDMELIEDYVYDFMHQ